MLACTQYCFVYTCNVINREASNKFFAYFKPHSSYPAVLGEMVCAGLNVMGFDWIASPACTELEVVTLDWYLQWSVHVCIHAYDTVEHSTHLCVHAHARIM